jgi:hypothetical protein
MELLCIQIMAFMKHRTISSSDSSLDMGVYMICIGDYG